MNELERMLKLAGVVSEGEELNEYRRKKEDADKKVDFINDVKAPEEDDIDVDFPEVKKSRYDIDDYSPQSSDLEDFKDLFDAEDPQATGDLEDADEEEPAQQSGKIVDVGDDDDFGFSFGDDLKDLGIDYDRYVESAGPDLENEDDYDFLDDVVNKDKKLRIVDVGDEDDGFGSDDVEDLGFGNQRYTESEQVDEVLSCKDDASEWIKDFQDSDDAKFSGDSKEKRKERALGAYYSQCEDVEESADLEEEDKTWLESVRAAFSDGEMKEEGTMDLYGSREPEDDEGFVDPEFDNEDDDYMVDIDDDSFDDGWSDMDADADTLASAGWGTDEDYGYYGDFEEAAEEVGMDNGYSSVQEFDAESSFPSGSANPRSRYMGTKQGDNPMSTKLRVSESKIYESLKKDLENFKKSKN